MDLKKEEERLVEKKAKAVENLKRKQKYLSGAVTSFKKARREFKIAVRALKVIRQQIKAGTPAEPDPVVEPEVIAEPESIEEKTD